MHRLLLPALVALAACDGGSPTDEDPGGLTLDEEGDGTLAPDTTEPSCGPVDLCTRTIDGCAYPMTLDSCTGWYDGAGNCADMDAYVECNCGCLAEDACDDYFGCGEACFAQHC